MRILLLPFTIFLSLAFSACGGSDGTATETAAEEMVISGAFAPAYEALNEGKSAAEIGSLLMQRFSAISDPNTGTLNREESTNFVMLAEKLADKYPNDTLSALPLYRAAEVVRAMNDPKKAAAIYERIHNDYATFSKAPESLFMLAFTYDEDLKAYDKAKVTYEKFMKLYPENVFAKSTPMLLENLGKSDEEILRQLEEKGQNME